ncbi:MAG: MFS transporter [Oscillospiraceae bacterium]|jgi:DHA3 family macrolide efflux protein-like MFS transporter|nr:MFS transporter [Oscillospiraceae bacterium]
MTENEVQTAEAHQPAPPAPGGWRRNITLYLASQIVSLFGSALAQCVIFWYISLETASGTMMTIAMISGFIPTFLISPFAGVWADRYDRKKIIILADSLVALATLALFILFRLGHASVWFIIGAMAVRGLGQGIQQPAVGALLPQLAPTDKLMRVNSISSSAQSAMMLVSPALGGVLYAAFPIEVTFAVDVVTAAVAVAILWFFVKAARIEPAPDSSAPSERMGYFGDLKHGLRYIKRHRFVGRLFAYMIPLALLIAPVAILFSLHLIQKFNADAKMLAINDTIFAVGMLAGSALMMIWGGFKRRQLTIAVGCLVMSVGTILYGVVPSFPLFACVTVILGLSMPLFNTASTVMLQENVENEYLGRVMSLLSMVTTLGMPIGLLVFGPLADKIGMWREFIFTGAAMLIMTILFMFDKRIRAAR